jgi:hypothetical protein
MRIGQSAGALHMLEWPADVSLGIPHVSGAPDTVGIYIAHAELD